MVKTVGEVVREIGLDGMPGVSFDFALPQDWVNEATRLAGANPCGHVVLVYDSRAKIFGRPYPLDYVGVDIVHILNAVLLLKYPEDMFFG